MRNLVFIALALAGAALIAFAVFMPQPKPAQVAETPKPPSGPNVVFIIVDTLRADRLHGERNGMPIMPKLSALAKQGRDFSMAISPASHTRSAVASLLTGQYVDTHGVYFGARRDNAGALTAQHLSLEWVTLDELLRDSGRSTFGFVTNGNIQAGSGYAQGFAPDDYVYDAEADASKVTDALLTRMKAMKPPFYLYGLYIEPHAPYFPPATYREMFGPPPELSDSDRETLEPTRQIAYLVMQVKKLLGAKMAERFAPLSEAGMETMRIWYDGECRFIDDEVSRLIEGVRAVHPDTVFVVTSDHGEEFWEHDGMGHGTTLYQEQIHVPLFIVGPGITPEAVHAPVNTLSIYKTVAELLQLSPPIAPRGDNLLGSKFEGMEFSRTRGPTSDLEVDIDAVLQGLSKGIRSAGSLYAYDLGSDPVEKQPLDDEVLLDRLGNSITQHEQMNEEMKPGRIVPEQAPVSDEQRRRLIELGYIPDEDNQ